MNEAVNSQNLRTIPFIIILFLVSFSAQAQQWESISGGKTPGVRFLDEYPLCWFSVSRNSPKYDIQFQSELSVTIIVSDIAYDAGNRIIQYSETVTGEDSQLPLTIFVSNIKYNSFGFVIEYYASVSGNEYSIETHIYDVTYNSLGQVTGFKELRTYQTSGNTYNIEVSNVMYDFSSCVLDGYDVTVQHDSQNVSPVNKKVSDYISYIDIEQIWDYGDPADSTDLMYEFSLGIYAFGNNMDADVNSIEILTPAGFTFLIPKQPGQWFDGIWRSYGYDSEWSMSWYEYRARFTDRDDLEAYYGDGEYTITLHYNNGGQSQTTAWFGMPDTNEPIPQPTQEPVLISPLHHQTLESPVTFSWEPCTDPNAASIHIDIYELGTIFLGDKGGMFDLDLNETIFGPVYMPDGVWEAELTFQQWILHIINNDGIMINLGSHSKSKYKLILEGSPWTMYEIWGGDMWIGWSLGYGNIANLEANGYVKLGESDGQTATFSGQYQYYVIATVGEFLLDSIQGSDGSYYSSFDSNWECMSISEPNDMLGPPDGSCALVGVSNPWFDYSGYFTFTNPGNWEGLTVITSDLNLNVSKEIENSADELGSIDPKGTVTYIINVDSNDLTNEATDVTIVDILPDEISFVSADSNEVSGEYDPGTHTYTWFLESLAPESEIELQLIARVNPDIAPGTTITNFVTTNSNETLPTTANADVVINQVVGNLQIVPETVRRNGTITDIMAVLTLPEGIDENIDTNEPLVLSPVGQNEVKIRANDNPIVTETDGRTKIIVVFDKTRLMEAIPEYGSIDIKVEGKFTSGYAFYGKSTITITRFAGN